MPKCTSSSRFRSVNEYYNALKLFIEKLEESNDYDAARIIREAIGCINGLTDGWWEFLKLMKKAAEKLQHSNNADNFTQMQKLFDGGRDQVDGDEFEFKQYEIRCIDFFTIQSFKALDTPHLITLFYDSVHQLSKRDYPQEQLDAWAPNKIDESLFTSQRMAKSTWVGKIQDEVGKVQDEIVGFIDLEPNGRIDMLHVSPSLHPEQRWRVQNELLIYVAAKAFTLKIPRLYTEASITALPVYERNGFNVIRKENVSITGEPQIHYKMEKPDIFLKNPEEPEILSFRTHKFKPKEEIFKPKAKYPRDET